MDDSHNAGVARTAQIYLDYVRCPHHTYELARRCSHCTNIGPYPTVPIPLTEFFTFEELEE